jgi:hypothetical protein
MASVMGLVGAPKTVKQFSGKQTPKKSYIKGVLQITETNKAGKAKAVDVKGLNMMQWRWLQELG